MILDEAEPIDGLGLVEEPSGRARSFHRPDNGRRARSIDGACRCREVGTTLLGSEEVSTLQEFAALLRWEPALGQTVGAVLERALPALNDQVRRTLPFATDNTFSENELDLRASAITREFAAGLPAIRGLLVSDLKAAYVGDPAATGHSEILLVYPGMTAVIHYRLAHALHGLGARFLARQICEIAHSLTGIDIHPGARIGGRFFIDHGTGVVIGETAVIGERVRLYQAVTLGARSFPADETGALIKGRPRHPIVEDDVVIYAGATILGRITVGRGSTIGGSVWLTHSVPPGSQITQAQLRSEANNDRQG